MLQVYRRNHWIFWKKVDLGLGLTSVYEFYFVLGLCTFQIKLLQRTKLFWASGKDFKWTHARFNFRDWNRRHQFILKHQSNNEVHCWNPYWFCLGFVQLINWMICTEFSILDNWIHWSALIYANEIPSLTYWKYLLFRDGECTSYLFICKFSFENP